VPPRFAQLEHCGQHFSIGAIWGYSVVVEVLLTGTLTLSGGAHSAVYVWVFWSPNVVVTAAAKNNKNPLR